MRKLIFIGMFLFMVILRLCYKYIHHIQHCIKNSRPSFHYLCDKKKEGIMTLVFIIIIIIFISIIFIMTLRFSIQNYTYLFSFSFTAWFIICNKYVIYTYIPSGCEIKFYILCKFCKYFV